MTRMTNYIASKIIAKAVEKAGFTAERNALAEEKYKLAEDFRVASIGGPEEATRIEKLIAQVEKQMTQLPEGICSDRKVGRRDYEMYRMNLGGLRVNMHFSDSTEDKRICPSGAVFEGDHPLVSRFHELHNKESEIDSREESLRQQIKAVIKSCTTVKKLLDVWPEAKELLPQQLEESRPQLPAVPVAELNKLVGLPSEQAPA